MRMWNDGDRRERHEALGAANDGLGGGTDLIGEMNGGEFESGGEMLGWIDGRLIAQMRKRGAAVQVRDDGDIEGAIQHERQCEGIDLGGFDNVEGSLDVGFEQGIA